MKIPVLTRKPFQSKTTTMKTATKYNAPVFFGFHSGEVGTKNRKIEKLTFKVLASKALEQPNEN